MHRAWGAAVNTRLHALPTLPSQVPPALVATAAAGLEKQLPARLCPAQPRSPTALQPHSPTAPLQHFLP